MHRPGVARILWTLLLALAAGSAAAAQPNGAAQESAPTQAAGHGQAREAAGRPLPAAAAGAADTYDGRPARRRATAPTRAWRYSDASAINARGWLRLLPLLGLVLVVSGGGLIWQISLQRLRDARRLVELTRIRAERLADMSHELRRPVGTMTLLAALLRRSSGLSERQRRLVEQLHLCGQRATDMFTAVRDDAYPRPVRPGGAPRAIDLRALIAETAALFAAEAEQRGLALQIEIAAAVPERVLLHPMHLRQVLENLLANALAFTREGSVTITADCGPDLLAISVADTGVGIPEGERERIFERSVRLGGAGEGRGLGLAIARRLAGRMAGSLGVTSRQGGGSVFRLTLPLAADGAGRPRRGDARP